MILKVLSDHNIMSSVCDNSGREGVLETEVVIGSSVFISLLFYLSSMLGNQTRVVHMLGHQSVTELHPLSLPCYLCCCINGPEIQDPPASASQVPGFQVCVTMPHKYSSFKNDSGSCSRKVTKGNVKSKTGDLISGKRR